MIIVLTGVLDANPVNIAYVERLGVRRAWLLPFPGSEPRVCEDCRGRMWVGPATLALAAECEASGAKLSYLCTHDAPLRGYRLADVKVIGA